MKTNSYLFVLLAGAVMFLVGFLIGQGRNNVQRTGEAETKETHIDTIRYYAPLPEAEVALDSYRYVLPRYRFIGSGVGGKPRQRVSNEGEIEGNDSVTATYGTGAGGVPRCCADSVVLELPVVQRHYADSSYEAWVSGPVDPRLDSIRVFTPTTIITKPVWKPPKRLHIGITAGYGFGAKGFQPYIGVGITYSIFSF